MYDKQVAPQLSGFLTWLAPDYGIFQTVGCQRTSVPNGLTQDFVK